MNDIEIKYEQAGTCPCGKGVIGTYRVIGKNVLSLRAYDKECAEHLSQAYNEIEALRKSVTSRDERIARMEEALRLWDENFHRNLASDNFLGDDAHEAHGVGELAISDDVKEKI